MCLQELTSDPQLFVDGACRLDIAQGRLGEQTHIVSVNKQHTVLLDI